jgi:hypothetical protein
VTIICGWRTLTRSGRAGRSRIGPRSPARPAATRRSGRGLLPPFRGPRARGPAGVPRPRRRRRQPPRRPARGLRGRPGAGRCARHPLCVRKPGADQSEWLTGEVATDAARAYTLVHAASINTRRNILRTVLGLDTTPEAVRWAGDFSSDEATWEGDRVHYPRHRQLNDGE